jgi:hypothetical protein
MGFSMGYKNPPYLPLAKGGNKNSFKPFIELMQLISHHMSPNYPVIFMAVLLPTSLMGVGTAITSAAERRFNR